MAEEKTTIQVSISLDDRIKALAHIQSGKLGLSKDLAKGTYLEMLITEEEKRIKNG